MEKTDEENELGPTGESNISQEKDEGSDTDNNSDSSSDSSEQGNESLSFDTPGGVLVSEIGKVEGENIQTGDQDREGSDQDELERTVEKELEEGVKDIGKYFEEGAEFIKAYQEMVGKERALDEVREREGEGRQMTDEEWEKEVEIAAYNAELIYKSVEEIETIPIKEKISEIKEELEIEKEEEQNEEISEPQLSDLKEEVREQEPCEETEHLKEQEEKEELEAQANELKEEVREHEQELKQIYEGRAPPLEQHQVEPFIKEALETVPEPITNEKEAEKLQELDIEEQFETVHLNDFVDELVEKEELEAEQLKEQVEKEELEAQTSKIKEANSELYEVVDVERDELDQHEVEATIAEALETEPEPIINEKEVEKLQELDIEEQFETAHLNEFVDELVEKEELEAEQLKEQEKKEELEAQTSKIKEANSELYDVVDVERDGLDQHEVEATIEEALKTEPEPIINEKEVEKLQELDIEEQFEATHLNEYVDELVERQYEDKNIENDKIKQEKENIEQTKDVIHQSTYLQKKLEEQELELELKYEEKDVVEQHQVEAAIEEELKTEPKLSVNEEELEYIKVLEPEKQLEAEVFYEFIEELANKQIEEKEEHEENEEQEEISTEQKVVQIMRELEIPKEINSDETEVESISQEGKKEQEPTFPDEKVIEQLEIEEYKDHQQELEEILEQNRKIEQEALKEIELGEEDLDKTIEKNYERAKSLYKQQTGKRPIYANKETKGFKQWLEQKKNSEEKEKTKQKKELKEEQKKEETWKWFLNNWIERATEIDSELKSELKKLVEEYDELEKLIKKNSHLYNKAHRELLSQAEKNELKSLIKALQKIDPIKIELFLGIREIKRYLDEQHFFDFWDEPRVNRIRHHFFTQLSQIYKDLKKNNTEDLLKNWIENASEQEISPELKAMLKEIVENYNELEKLAIRFMELYKKEQFEQISQSEKVELKSLIKTLEKMDPINIVLFANIRAIKRYLNDQHLDDFSNKTRINRVISKFFKHISQKFKELRIYNFINIETDSFQKDIKTFLVQKNDFNKEELEIVDEFSKYESNPEIEKNDELEKLKQKYKEETGKRPIHAGTRMFGVYKKYIPTKEYENSVKLREDRNKKTKERIATLKKTLFKLYHDIGKEVEKYSYLAGIATNPTGVTHVLLGGTHCHAGLKSLGVILKNYAKIEKIYEQVQDRLKEKIEFSHWAIIKDKFEKAISLKQRVTDLSLSIARGGHKKDTFDIRVSKYPSEKAHLMVDLFNIALKYIFKSQQRVRNYYAQVFSDIIFGNPRYLTHAWLGNKVQTQRKALPTSLFMILFNIFQLDTTKIKNRVGNIRQFTKSGLNEFKLTCYSVVKKLFLDSYISNYFYKYDDVPKNDRYVGSKHFELEFDLLWSVWYAYAEWIANQNPGILDNMFEHDSPFRKKFSNTYFFRGFTGYSSEIFKNIQIGLHISKRHVFSMFNKLTLMSKNIGTSSFPNQHAIENALGKVENYLQVRHPKKEGDRVLAFHDYFFVNNILVSSKGALLPKIYRNYLKVASNFDGSFPFSASYYEKNHPNDYQRCSNFEIQVGTISADYSKFIQDRLVSQFSDLKNDKILVVDSVNGRNSPKPIQDLLKLVESFSGHDPKNFLNPSHPAINGMVKAKLSDYVLATELPVWRKVGAKLVTGHVDLVLLIGDTLFVCDYKPGDKANSNTKRFSHSFLMSLPQVAAYSKLHRTQYNVKKIYCVTFNEDGRAWIYQDKVLNSLENLLIAKGYSDWLIWNNYIF